MGFVRRRARRRTALVVEERPTQPAGTEAVTGVTEEGYDDAGQDQQAAPPPQAAAAPAEASPGIDYGELEQLGKLHADGTLTDEEFAAAKAKILEADPRDRRNAIASARADGAVARTHRRGRARRGRPGATRGAGARPPRSPPPDLVSGSSGSLAGTTTVASWRASPPSSGAGIASCRRCGSRNRCATAGWRTHSSPVRRPRLAAEAARSSCFSYDLLARGLYDRLGYETVGVIENCPAEALRAGTARTCEAALLHRNRL